MQPRFWIESIGRFTCFYRVHAPGYTGKWHDNEWSAESELKRVKRGEIIDDT